MVGNFCPVGVADAFVKQYYFILKKCPENLHKFYKEPSILGWPGSDGVVRLVTTLNDINVKVMSSDYKYCSAEVKTADAQQSIEGGIIVAVTGCLVRKDSLKKNFSQTFFLAKQERGFYVLNDILRFFDVCETTTNTASSTDDENNEPARTQGTVPCNTADSPTSLGTEAGDENEKVEEATVDLYVQSDTLENDAAPTPSLASNERLVAPETNVKSEVAQETNVKEQSFAASETINEQSVVASATKAKVPSVVASATKAKVRSVVAPATNAKVHSVSASATNAKVPSVVAPATNSKVPSVVVPATNFEVPSVVAPATNSEVPSVVAPATNSEAPSVVAPATNSEAPSVIAPATKAEAPSVVAPATKAEAPSVVAPATKAEAPSVVAPATKAEAPSVVAPATNAEASSVVAPSTNAIIPSVIAPTTNAKVPSVVPPAKNPKVPSVVSPVPNVTPKISYASVLAKETPVTSPKAAAVTLNFHKQTLAPATTKASAALANGSPKASTPGSSVSKAFTSSSKVSPKSPTAGQGAINEGPKAGAKGIYIGGLPFDITKQGVVDVVKKFGPVRRYSDTVQLRRHEDGFCCGFVEFESADAARRAVEAHHVMFGETEAYITYKRSLYSRGNSGGARSPTRGGGNRNGNLRGQEKDDWSYSSKGGQGKGPRRSSPSDQKPRQGVRDRLK